MSGGPGGGALLSIDRLVVEYHQRRGLRDVLRRRPGTPVHAVTGVSLTVNRGEMVAVVGESGSGKTSMAMAALGLLDVKVGSVWVDGVDITRSHGRTLQELRRRIQMIYQDPYESLDPRFTVLQTVEEPLLIHRIGGPKASRRRRVADALTRAGLSPPDAYLDRHAHELSGGQRQRVAIAASLVLEPDVLVADEPVSMLDVSVRAGILALLNTLREAKLAVLMITHDLATASHFADRIAVMYLGAIVEEGSARSVIDNPSHPYTQALLAAVPGNERLDIGGRGTLPADVPDSSRLPSGCRFHPRCPYAEDECRSREPALSPVHADDSHSAACILVERR